MKENEKAQKEHDTVLKTYSTDLPPNDPQSKVIGTQRLIHERFRRSFATIYNVIELAIPDQKKATAAKDLIGAELSSTEEDCKKYVNHSFS